MLRRNGVRRAGGAWIRGQRELRAELAPVIDPRVRDERAGTALAEQWLLLAAGNGAGVQRTNAEADASVAPHRMTVWPAVSESSSHALDLRAKDRPLVESHQSCDGAHVGLSVALRRPRSGHCTARKLPRSRGAECKRNATGGCGVRRCR